MKVNTTLPFDNAERAEEFCTPDAVTEIGAVLERAGFAAGCVTDHPAPTGRWLDAGGHNAQDPFVMLSFLAAATSAVRLQTGILVLPYRNPFITARAVSTLDVFSGGRVTLGVGTGYLKGEYRALGVDFEQRNTLTDEYLRALKVAWGADEFAFEGSGFAAPGTRILPRPLQVPHPPLLIGGNARRAIRRAVEFGDAWNPFFTTEAVSTVSRTAAMTDVPAIADGVAYLRQYCETLGREHPPEVVVAGLTGPDEVWEASALLDRIAALAELGVTAVSVQTGGRTRAEWCDNAERLGAEIIAALA